MAEGYLAKTDKNNLGSVKNVQNSYDSKRMSHWDIIRYRHLVEKLFLYVFWTFWFYLIEWLMTSVISK